MSHRSPSSSRNVRAGASTLLGGALLAAALASPASAAVTTGTRGSAEWTVIGGDGSPTYPGDPGTGGFVDGTDALAVTLAEADSTSVAPDGSTYVVTRRDEVVRLAGGKAYRVAGGGQTAAADGLDARAARLDRPSVDAGPDGTLTITSDDALFTLTADGHLDEIPWAYPSGEIPRSAADFEAVDVDQLGRTLVVDRTTSSILRISPDGTTVRVAGGGTAEARNGGIAAESRLGNVVDVAGGPGGELYVVGTYAGAAAVWRVGTDGKLRLFAGSESTGWPTCSPAPQNTLQAVRLVATDSFGRVYVAGGNGVVKVRGDGQQQWLGSAGGPDARPFGLAIGPADELVVASSDSRVRRSPFVAERENSCRAAPYRHQYQQIAAQELVASQLVRFHASMPDAQTYDWADLIYRTTLDPSDLVVELAHRSAFAGPVGGTSRLYLATFGRAADTSGLRYWSTKRFAGTPLAAIATTFTRSSEFQRTYGSLGNAAFVDRIYRNVLGRAGDPGGRSYWTKRLDSGTGRGTVLVQFSESSEFVRKTAVRTEATLAVFGLLGRAPTSSEVEAWTRHLADGHTVSELVAWVWYSAEHATRVQKKLG